MCQPHAHQHRGPQNVADQQNLNQQRQFAAILTQRAAHTQDVNTCINVGNVKALTQPQDVQLAAMIPLQTGKTDHSDAETILEPFEYESCKLLVWVMTEFSSPEMHLYWRDNVGEMALSESC